MNLKTMLRLSSLVVSRRVYPSLRYNCIKSIQTKANQLSVNPNAGILGFPQRFNRLETTLRRSGKISSNELNLCLKELSISRNVRPTTSQSLLLIRSCGALITEESPERRSDLCQRMFERLSEVTDLDVSHYNQLLRVFVENQLEFNAIDFLEKMQMKGIVPNRVTFMFMIQRFCQNGSISEAIKILEHMKSEDMAINETVFNSLILGYGKAGDLGGAEQTLDMMRASELEPSADTYTALLCAYVLNAKNPEIEEKINKTFDEITKSEIQLTESHILRVYKTLVLVDSESPLLDKLMDRINKTRNYNKECLEVINELLFANKVETALKLYETMTISDHLLNKNTVGNPLIRTMIRANVSPQTILDLCDKLQSQGKNDSAIRHATEYALESSSIADCRTYLRRFGEECPLKLHFFYPLIVKCENESQILEVLGEDMNIFTNALYSQLIELFVDYIWPKNVSDVHSFIEKCNEIGFSFVITVNSLIRYYIRNADIPAAINLMSSPTYSSVNIAKRDITFDLTDSVFKGNTVLTDVIKALQLVNKRQRFSRTIDSEITDYFGQFLHTLVRRRISQSLLNRVLLTFNEKSIKISEESILAICERNALNEENENLLKKLMAKSSDELKSMVSQDISDVTKQRRDMNPEELESHFVELKSKGLNTRGILRSLLMSYYRRSKSFDDNKSDVLVTNSRNRVKQILAELQQSNFEFSNQLYAMLMDFFVNCGDIDSALEMKAKIGKDFEVVSSKIFNLATLYVKNGDIDRAVDLINAENSLKSETIESEDISSGISRLEELSIFRLLDSLIEANVDFKLLREVFDLSINYSGVTPNSVMAGPLVKYHFLKGDYSSALETLEECAEKYRITPWNRPVMRHFVDNSDHMNLQRVVDCSDKVHGEFNTIWELTAVCIEAGKINQAKKLLDTPGLKARPQKIDHICQNMTKENNIEALEQLIRCTKHVFVINRDQILYYLIKCCIKSESPQKALNCWTLMQEENIQPSDNTLILLANFLKENNIDVPFTVPSDPIQIFKPKPKDGSIDSTNDPLQRFNEAIKTVDIDEALRIRKSLELENKSLLMSQNSSLIEVLLNSERIDEAFALTTSLLSSKEFPSPRVIRYLYTKLSSLGDIKRLEELGSLSPEFMIQSNAFTNALSFAYIKNGNIEELIDNKMLTMKPFPLGGFLHAFEVRPDLEERLICIANQLITDSDYHLPLNMVWISLMKSGRFDEADRIFDSCPKLREFLLFSTLLDSIRENKNIVLAKKLVETVSKSNLTPKSVGVTYSALIDAYVESEDISAAEDLVVNEVVNCTKTRTDPKSGVEEKLLDINQLNRSTLKRLVSAIRRKERREPKFQGMPTRTTAPPSSSDEEFSSSSDEEVVDVKNK